MWVIILLGLKGNYWRSEKEEGIMVWTEKGLRKKKTTESGFPRNTI